MTMKMMSNKEMIHQISGLLELDAACVNAYARALPEIDTPELSDQLQVLYKDHVLRLRELEMILRQLGGNPQMTPIEPLSEEHHSTIGASVETLKAVEEIRAAERAAQLAYDMASLWELPEYLKARILEFREREHQDIAFVERVLVSVRAAANLWGDEDQPPILHH